LTADDDCVDDVNNDDDVRHHKELSRLLSTAEDKDRKDLILKAIQSLDDNDMSNEQYRLIHSISPSAHASLFMSENVRILYIIDDYTSRRYANGFCWIDACRCQ
jgi:hypothetical protein